MDQPMTYEQWMQCLCLWREARGSSLPALAAINAVFHNRVNDAHNRWPKNLVSVILQPRQFSSFNAGDPNAVKFPNPAQSLSPDWKAWLDCQTVVLSSVGGDPTMGATNYVSLVNGDIPAGAKDWATPDRMTLSLGAFRFFRL